MARDEKYKHYNYDKNNNKIDGKNNNKNNDRNHGKDIEYKNNNNVLWVSQ